MIMKILSSIISFFKTIFEKDIKISVENNNKYNVKKNKKCNISIIENGDNNEAK